MTSDRLEQLERLARLRAQNALTDDEFASEKARLLGGDGVAERTQLEPPGVGSSGQRHGARRFAVAGGVLAAAVCLVGGLLIVNDFPPGQKAQVPLDRAITPPANVRPVAVSAPAKPAASKRPECTGKACRTLTAKGWAGIEAEMTVAAAERASGLDIKSDGHYDDVEGTCRRYEVVGGPETVSMLVEDDVVTSLTAWSKDFATPRGIRVGDSEAKLRKSYEPLRQEADIYGATEDKMLFYDVQKGRFGIKFAINEGSVSSITVGGSSRGYVEGCL